MDPMQKWLDELTIIHLGCIVEYGPDGRLNFIDVPNDGEKQLSLENGFSDQHTQSCFNTKINYTDNESAGETEHINESRTKKVFDMKKIKKVRNASNKIEKKKNKKKGKKNKIVPINVEASQSVDHRLQLLDKLVSKMAVPERRELSTTESQLNVGLVRKKHSKRMRLEGGFLSPVPEETLEHAERLAKEGKNALTRLFSQKKQSVELQYKKNNRNKTFYSENRCAPVFNEKRKPQGGAKAQWSKLKLLSLLGKTKSEQSLIVPKLHVRKAERCITRSIFPRLFLKQNKVKPTVC